MKNHIYLHTSNFENTRFIRNDESFFPPFNYTPQQYEKLLGNEYGIIETDDNYYHILVGSINQDGCPWCGGEAIVKKLFDGTKEMPIQHSIYCMECVRCRSRGPLLNLIGSTVDIEEYFEFMRNRYKRRLSLDSDFINPYETKTK